VNIVADTCCIVHHGLFIVEIFLIVKIGIHKEILSLFDLPIYYEIHLAFVDFI
jgi:hypothetical protein